MANLKSKKRSVCAPSVVYHFTRHGKVGAGNQRKDLTAEFLCLLADTRKPEPTSHQGEERQTVW